MSSQKIRIQNPLKKTVYERPDIEAQFSESNEPTEYQMITDRNKMGEYRLPTTNLIVNGLDTEDRFAHNQCMGRLIQNDTWKN